ncbi:uncharacterized protein PFL1_06214 [Pseudozyma flocculosa PF-1]|uniref:Uncharacterized protein n=1 Tax=Pseudozyma flocculosa PF-1 TaxID=1277687 RepID=A0A061H262_9BASI|nr:uncharacterized protein PFL1_06214 [Pseudozyma flocculosa PF-1]EPQ26279.1 hypothetical protein PFL1_06214 [Pseudozyma flocculosa PF-1]
MDDPHATRQDLLTRCDTDGVAGLRKVACCIRGETTHDGHGGKLGLLTLDPDHAPHVRVENAEWGLDRLQKIEVVYDEQRDAYRLLMAANPHLGLCCQPDRRAEWDTPRRRQSRTGKDLSLGEHPSWFKIECEACDEHSCWYTIRPLMDQEQECKKAGPTEAAAVPVWNDRGDVDNSQSGPAARPPASAVRGALGEWNVTPIKDSHFPPPYPVHLIWRSCERQAPTWCFMRI